METQTTTFAGQRHLGMNVYMNEEQEYEEGEGEKRDGEEGEEEEGGGRVGGGGPMQSAHFVGRGNEDDHIPGAATPGYERGDE